MKIWNRGMVAAIALFYAMVAFTMPTEKELVEVKPLVNELMAPFVKAYKTRKMSGTEVGDKALELAGSAETDAAVFICMRGAVYYYSRDKAYDKAADAIEAIISRFPDMPQDTLLEITTSAIKNASAKSATRLIAIHKVAARKAAIAKKLRTLRAKLKKTPADKDLIRRYAELTAANGDWEKSLKAFARLGGVVGKMAQDELDCTAASAALAAFWWDYAPAENAATAAIRRHAASHYQAALDAGEFSGLEITLAERRIAEAQPGDDTAQAAPSTAKTSPSGLVARPAAAPTLQYKFEYKLDDKGNAILYGGPMPKPKGVLVIPDKIDGHTVTEIEGDCFRCEEVTRIVLPPHLEKLRGTTWNRVHIPGAKFCKCYNLESIEISPANQSFTSVNGALYTKDKKRLIVYPKTSSSISLARECNVIGEAAFGGCKKFKTVKIPDSVTGIMSAAFLECENLETVEFPKGVNDFGAYVFPCCPDLRKVVFHGDAPGHWVRRMASGALDTLLSHSNCDIVIEVEKGSTGWAGKDSTTLPARWPLDGNTYDSRPIRYIGEMSPYRKPGVAKGWKVEVAIGYFTGNVPNEQFLDSGNNASDYYPVLALGVVADRASAIAAERVSFPGNPGAVRFTSRSKGTMRVPAAGDWTFAVQSDDGYRVKISGNGYSTVFSGGITRERAICHTVTLPATGNYEVEVLHSNLGGGAYLEFSAAKGRFTDFRPSEFKLVGDPTGLIKMK